MIRAVPRALLLRGVRVLLVGLAALLGAASPAPRAWCGSSQATLAEPRASSASSLPRQQILRRTLRADTSQSYLLYVPAAVAREAPVFVTVHGISLNVAEHAALFAPFAEQHGRVLVAPAFTGQENDDYQRLGREGRGGRADQVLDAILEEVRSLTGVSILEFDLFGFSGGAQFVHRYALAHPERIAAAVVAAPGWYMFPDATTPYPYGLGASSELPDVRFEPKRFLRVPILVIVGEADTTSRNLRRNPSVDRQQGTTRVERAVRWTAAMRRAADSLGVKPLVTLERVPGIGHSFGRMMREGDLGERVFGFLLERSGASPSLAPQSAR